MKNSCLSQQKRIKLYGVKYTKNHQISQNILNGQDSVASQEITINLNKWKILAQGGAFLAFHMADYKNHCSNSSKPQPNAYCESQKYQQEGKYVMKTRKIKWMKDLIKMVRKIMIKSIQNKEQSCDLDIKEAILQMQKVFSEIKQKSGELILKNLIQKIYSKFISKVIAQNEQAKLLPCIEQTLVKQSKRYFFHNSQHKSEAIQDQKDSINAFIQFVFSSLLKEEIKSYVKKQQLSFNEEDINTLITKNLGLISKVLEVEIYFPFLCVQDLYVTFQQNLLNERNSQNQKTYNYELSNQNPINKSQREDTNQSQLFKVFELKLKTIIPDCYSERFLDLYVNQYDSIVKKYEKQKSESILQSQSLKSQLSEKKDEIIRLVQKSVQSSKSQLLNIQSTRWFKKNCLYGDQNKKNENPLIFFNKSLKNSYQGQLDSIDLYSKKHLRKSNAIKTKQKIHATAYNISQNYQKNMSLETILEHIHKIPTQRQNKNNITSENSAQNNRKLSLVQEIVALQLIDIVDLESNYFDKNKLNEITQNNEANKPIRIIADIVQVVKITTWLQNVFCKSNIDITQNPLIQHMKDSRFYPKNAFSMIHSLFQHQVYNRSQKLRNTLKQVIFESQQINLEIEINLRYLQNTSNNSQDFIKNVKLALFFIIRFLISLTWKDISLMICSKQGSQIQKCKIIDYNIKTVQNIYKNLQKEKQFLYYYQKYSKNSTTFNKQLAKE